MDNLIVRPAVPEDAQALLAIYAPYVKTTAITFEYAVPSREEFRGRIERTLQRYPYLVAEQDRTPLGYAYLGAFVGRSAYDWAAETSIYLDKSRRRMGLGKRLYTVLEALALAQHITNLNACIGVPPRGDDPYLTWDSVSFHAHMGYRQVGEFQQCGYKFGRWYNMAWMEKHIAPHPDAPEPFCPFPGLDREALLEAGLTL